MGRGDGGADDLLYGDGPTPTHKEPVPEIYTGPLACPSCGLTSQLATIEKLDGDALLNSVSAGGEPDFEGTTEIHYDSSKTVGIRCRSCYWEYEGADWQDELKPTKG